MINSLVGVGWLSVKSMTNVKVVVMDIDFDFGWIKDIQPMEPGMGYLKDNFDNLQKVIKGDRIYYVDSEQKPLFYYQDSENGWVDINYNRIWFILGKDFGLNYSEIQELMRRWLEGTYKIRGFTPLLDFIPNARIAGRDL